MPQKLKLHDKVPFRALITQRRKIVPESLQLGGHFPGVTAETASSADWNAALTDRFASLQQELRFSESDPEVARIMVLRLAEIATICEAWAEQLEGE